MLQLLSLVFMVALGVSIAGSTRVGQQLGAGNAEGAQLTSDVMLYLQYSLSLGLTLVVFLVRRVWGRVFTMDDSVNDLVAELLPFVSFLTWFDGVQYVIGGVLRGAGHQIEGAKSNFVAQWLVGLPLSSFMVFGVGWRSLFALWGGLGVGIVVQCGLLRWYLAGIDWDAEAAIAQERANQCDTGEHEHVALADPLTSVEPNVSGFQALPTAAEEGVLV